MTVGAAITVDNKATPPAPPPKVIAIKTVSTLSTILATLKYFLLKASLVATSFQETLEFRLFFAIDTLPLVFNGGSRW